MKNTFEQSIGVQDVHERVDVVRHSKALYAPYAEILAGEDPERTYDPERDQSVETDLSEKGRDLARKEAEAYFDAFDPQETAVFFVSSTELRALETGDIYLKVAKERGFEIIPPDNVRSEVAERIGGGMIRSVKALSLGELRNTLVSSVYNPEAYLGKINWDAVSDETKAKWTQAREIINADDQGSWGGNFFKHSQAMKEIFSDEKYGVKTAEEVFRTRFQQILKLVAFANEKALASGHPKQVKVLGFGHENYFVSALDHYLGQHELPNCSFARFSVDGGNGQVFIERDGRSAAVGSDTVED